MKVVYLSIEMAQTTAGPTTLTQEAINQAFKRGQRITKRIAKISDGQLFVLTAKNTGRVGVAEGAPWPEYGRMRFTDIERTLIDCTVRPVYAGGVLNVKKAYERARPKVSVKRLYDLLQQLRYVYPFHQAVGFYLEQAGYDREAVKMFRQLPITHDFYLAHGMKDTTYIHDWRLHVPRWSISS